MDNRLTRTVRAGCLGLVLGMTSAQACTFDMIGLGAFDVAYPGSLSVAVAIAGAKQNGTLPSLDPSKSAWGYAITVKRVEAFGARLSDALQTTKAAPEPGPFSLILVGPRLWTTFTPVDGGFEAAVHASGPLQNRPVILTEFVVLDAILRGTMSIETALADGLIKVADDDDRTVLALLAAA